MTLTSEQIKMMQEELSANLVEMLMDRWHYTSAQALSTLYNSDVFSRIQDPRTGLYYQSPGYVFDYLEDEITQGKIQ